MLATYIS